MQKNFKPVRSLAYDPKGTLLASCHEDGAVFIWSTEDGSLVHELGKARWMAARRRTQSASAVADRAAAGPIRPQVAPSIGRADWNAYNRIAWHPRGAFLAVPGRNNDVTLFERKEWGVGGVLKGGHNGDVSLLAFSPNGLYCVTAGMDQQLVLWCTKKAAKARPRRPRAAPPARQRAAAAKP